MCDVIGRADSLRISTLPVNIEYARPVFIHDHPRIRGMLSGDRRLACSIGFQPPRGSRRAAPLIPEAERKYHYPFCVSSPAGCHPVFGRMFAALPFGVPAHLPAAGAIPLPQRKVPDKCVFSCQCASEFSPSTYRSRERPKAKSF